MEKGGYFPSPALLILLLWAVIMHINLSQCIDFVNEALCVCACACENGVFKVTETGGCHFENEFSSTEYAVLLCYDSMVC